MAKKLPVPPPQRGRPRGDVSIKLEALEPGHKVRIVGATFTTVRATAHYWGRRLGRMFVTRVDGEAIDVWRVS